MKKGQKKTYSNNAIMHIKSEESAKAYAENRWKGLKERYKHHKTTSYYAFKEGIMHALANPVLLSLIHDDILSKAGLMRKDGNKNNPNPKHKHKPEKDEV